MAFQKQLQKSVDWLLSVQNQDGGWGIVPNQQSSIVNTAEALYVLKRGKKECLNEYKTGLAFIENQTFLHVKSHGPRVRYVAFALMAFCDNYHNITGFGQQCIDWLIAAKNDDNGWGNSANDNTSDLFNTFLAIWSLQKTRTDINLNTSYQWLLSKFNNNGWRFSENEPVSPVATAYATYCLASSVEYASHESVLSAKSFLLQTRHWEPCEEVTGGTLWKHCPYTWVIPALVTLGEDPYCTTIAEGIRVINKLYDNDDGWGEGVGQSRKTIRAQFWAVFALYSLKEAFDPSKHILRIDEDRVQTSLSGPDYIKFGMQSCWATIIPARIYRYSVYGMFAIATLILFGMHRKVATLPSKTDPIIAALLLFFVWLLIRKREFLFPRWSAFVKYTLTVITIFDFIFGVSLIKLLDFAIKLKEIFVNVFLH